MSGYDRAWWTARASACRRTAAETDNAAVRRRFLVFAERYDELAAGHTTSGEAAAMADGGG
ncbi:hypothetical protein [Sphingomonas colocasiae]|uniref:Uncharacterized protein n=1 Tax=Sphingomonas colocasiae TaxID=1848973 RepID=A0ABS7PSX3_9SPHN|nr:hypothetical protein [Sphingomonas colocasiae]MBY8823487.1 hypothetical protein [Sphingomonas colocasiae]